MSRLPTPGGDEGEWGDVLNDYLSQAHKSDGTLKDNSVTTANLAPNTVTATEIKDGTITQAQLATEIQEKLNSVTSLGTQTVNVQTGPYTLILADAGKLIVVNTAAATTLTLPAGVFAAGQWIDILNQGAGTVTLAAGIGASLAGASPLTQGTSVHVWYMSTSVASVAASTLTSRVVTLENSMAAELAAFTTEMGA